MSDAKHSYDHQVLISIPLAVYNGQRTVEKAINSVLKQDHPNWELLCVDDGSSDCSADILYSYSRQDHRIRVFRQSNRGPGKARLVAYREGKGDYFLSGLDSDDYIETSFLSKMVETALNCKTDVIICDWMVEQENGSFFSLLQSNGIDSEGTISGIEAFRMTLPWKIPAIGLWSKRLVNKNAIQNESAFNNYDCDEYLGRLMLLDSGRIAFSMGRYFHCRNPKSITSSPSLRKLQSLDTNVRLLKLAKERKLDSDIQLRILRYQRNYLANILKAFVKNGRKFTLKQLSQVFNECRSYRKRLFTELCIASNKGWISGKEVRVMNLKLWVHFARFFVVLITLKVNCKLGGT